MVSEITVVRVYLTESEKLLKPIMGYLHDEAKVKGVTVFRAISGFGKSGTLHSSDLMTMAMDLPLVVEFFDVPQRADEIIAHLKSICPPSHIVSWVGKAH